MLDVEKIKKDFPIFRRRLDGKRLIYLDSASTSQKPEKVIEAMSEFYRNGNANVHRSVYRLSEEATEAYESTRKKVARFIGAEDYHIIFTKNCTEAINLVAQGWAKRNLKKGDSILSSVMEHHSNIVPWQRLRGMKLRFLGVDASGKLEPVERALARNTRLISLTHASNVLGTVNDARGIAKAAHDNGSLFALDAAQSVPHMKIDVGKIGCDFLSFSGHKMLGPTGIGVLAVKKEVAEDMDPLLFGSDMIREVTLKKATFAGSPMKFETGTPDTAGAIGLAAAIDYLEGTGMDKIEKHGNEMSKHVSEALSGLEKLKVYGHTLDKLPIFSFSLGDAHPHDIATVLDSVGVAVRSGHHCAQPLMKSFGVGSMTRASFYIYNGPEDVEALVSGLDKVGDVLKI